MNAIRIPVANRGVEITAAALDRIVMLTEEYPYFLQEWGAHAWNAASASPITDADVEEATEGALRALDGSFFKVRFDRLTNAEKRYMRAMASLGPGPHPSRRIAEQLGFRTTAVSPIRDRLVRKGMIYSVERGKVAFTVPMFDAFMRRCMPNWTPAKRQPGKKSSRKATKKPAAKKTASRPRRHE